MRIGIDLESTDHSIQRHHDGDHDENPRARPGAGPGVAKNLQEVAGVPDMGDMLAEETAEREE